jgi:hypothetical protein
MNRNLTMIRRIEMTEDEINRLPWTRDLMTLDEFAQWVASRKEAGAAIDIETCELGRWYAYDLDPYGTRDLLDEEQQVGTNRWVRSPQSRGWINEEDLPLEKFKAMYARISREYEAWQQQQADAAEATESPMSDIIVPSAE